MLIFVHRGLMLVHRGLVLVYIIIHIGLTFVYIQTNVNLLLYSGYRRYMSSFVFEGGKQIRCSLFTSMNECVLAQVWPFNYWSTFGVLCLLDSTFCTQSNIRCY